MNRLEVCRKEWETQTPNEYVPSWLPGLLTDSAPQELVDEVTSTMLDLHPVGYRLVIESMMTDMQDLLPQIGVPTLLVWGEQDVRSPIRIAREFEDAIPGAELIIVPDSGHMTHVEQPERFNAAVSAFCQTLG